MAELPGWDRQRLAVAAPSDVEAARLLVFASRVKPLLDVDVADRIRDIEREETPASPVQLRAERARRVEALRALERAQPAIREALGLDPLPIDHEDPF